jgi:hypothetical protein
MGSVESFSCVTVKIFVKKDVVSEKGIILVEVVISVNGTPAFVISPEDIY